MSKNNRITSGINKLNKDHYKWATEALTSYAAYRMNGSEPSVTRGLEPPVQWPQGVLPDELEEFEAWPIDYEHKDYLLVRDEIAEHVKEHPQDASLPELIVHVCYYGKPIKDFMVVPTFGRNPWRMKELGCWAIANAAHALKRIITLVAIDKMEQEQKVA